MTPPISQTDSATLVFSFAEVAALLQVTPEKLRELCLTYTPFLGVQATASDARYSHADLATLITVQTLQGTGQDSVQIAQQLVAKSVPGPVSDTNPQAVAPQWSTANPAPVPVTAAQAAFAQQPQPEHALVAHRSGEVGEVHTVQTQALNAMLHTVASSQQSMLNVQESAKEMLGVVVQDNFNLKHENRKLRERMLELERAMAEYQRREETRKERLEGRLRALEGTLGAMQQQLAQMVQLHRQRERRGWFW